jgi:hypothetical protein
MLLLILYYFITIVARIQLEQLRNVVKASQSIRYLVQIVSVFGDYNFAFPARRRTTLTANNSNIKIWMKLVESKGKILIMQK